MKKTSWTTWLLLTLFFVGQSTPAVADSARMRTVTPSSANSAPAEWGVPKAPPTVGNVEMSAREVEDVLAVLDLEGMDAKALNDLLASWDPAMAEILEGAEREALLPAMYDVLDPDGDGRVAVIRWQTLKEHGALGFYVERQGSENGPWQRLGDDLLRGLLTAREGGDYLLLDPRASGRVRYQVVEQQAWGGQRHYGPWTVDLSDQAAATPVRRALIETGADTRPDTREEHWGPWRWLGRGYAARPREPVEPDLAQVLQRRAQVSAKRKGKGAKAVRLHTGEEALYRVAATEVAENTRWSENRVHKRLRRHGFEISAGGKPVPYHYDEAERALYVAAESYRTYETLENVYNLAKGKGQAMASAEGPGPAAGARGVFRDTLVLEKDIWEQAWVQFDEQGDVWFWDYLYANGAATATADFTLELPGLATTGEVVVTVHLQGASDAASGYDHRARLALNGTDLGVEESWNGFGRQKIDVRFDAGNLATGRQLQVIGTAVYPSTLSYFWVDRIEVIYPRHMQARDDQLIVHGVGPGAVTVDGFSNAYIRVIDGYGTASPRWRTDTTVAGAPDGSWQVTVTLDETTDLLVSAKPRTARVEANAASKLKKRNHRADYLIIAPRAFAAGAEALAAYRSQRYRTEIAWLDDIYDEFSYGLTDSEAIEAFLDHVKAKWRRAPQYVVLLGRGTYDHRNDRKGLSESWIPHRLAYTRWGVVSSDSRYADVDGDKVGDFALGRIGAMSDAEVQAYVTKLQSYEAQTSDAWSTHAALVADNPDAAGDFHANSEQVREALTGYGMTSERLFHPTDGAVSATLKANWGAGAYGLVHYEGHGFSMRLGDRYENFLDTATAKSLANGARLPVFAALSCSVGNSEVPGARSLTDTLVLNADGGAIAGYSATGLSLDWYAHRMSLAFLDALAGRSLSVGEAAVEAGATAAAIVSDGLAFMLDIYHVSGDPAVGMIR